MPFVVPLKRVFPFTCDFEEIPARVVHFVAPFKRVFLFTRDSEEIVAQ